MSLFVWLSLFGIQEAAATQDVIYPYTYVYADPQWGGYCYGESRAWRTSVNVGEEPYLDGIFGEVIAPWEGGPASSLNLNTLDVGLQVSVNTRRFTPTYVATVEIDVRPLLGIFPNTVVLTKAKLALLAITENLRQDHGRDYRVTVNYIGLPSQVGVPGTALPAQKTYEYNTATLRALQTEWIDTSGQCF